MQTRKHDCMEHRDNMCTRTSWLWNCEDGGGCCFPLSPFPLFLVLDQSTLSKWWRKILVNCLLSFLPHTGCGPICTETVDGQAEPGLCQRQVQVWQGGEAPEQ